ncbi:MAG TPA: FAD-binding oxidoreductase, partial [Gammaproteobacteria bacterium]|nr:FAD-binding oxidoreductase [Gammaproteobacteria bacterium]
LRKAYPAVREIKAAESWAGMIDVTPDALPVISKARRLPGLTLATGFSGHGFGIGPAAGRLAADMVSAEAPIVDPSAFDYQRMTDGTKLIPQGL